MAIYEKGVQIMSYNDNWDIDIRRSIKRFEAKMVIYPGIPGGGIYPDSRFYRRGKPIVTLQNNGRKYIPHDSKTATLLT